MKKYKNEIISVLLIIALQLFVIWRVNSQTKANFENGNITYSTKVILPVKVNKLEKKLFSTIKEIVNTIPAKTDWTIEFQMEFLDKPDYCEIEYSEGQYELFINTVSKAKSTNISAIRAYLISEWYFMITHKNIFD